MENKELAPRLKEGVGSNSTNRSEGMMVSVGAMLCQGSRETNGSVITTEDSQSSRKVGKGVVESFRWNERKSWILEMPYQNDQEDLGQEAVEGVKMVSWNMNLPDKEGDDVATDDKEYRKQKGFGKTANEFI